MRGLDVDDVAAETTPDRGEALDLHAAAVVARDEGAGVLEEGVVLLRPRDPSDLEVAGTL